MYTVEIHNVYIMYTVEIHYVLHTVRAVLLVVKMLNPVIYS